MPQPVSEQESEQLEEALGNFSEEFREHANHRSETMAWTYLMKYGIPKEPVDVVYLCQSIFQGSIAHSVVQGFVTLNPNATASDAEKAEFKATIAAARAEQVELEKMLGSFAGGNELASVGGNYL